MKMKIPERWTQGMREHIPIRMIGGLVRYIEDGVVPGDFWMAILQNDLKEACAMADEENKYLIYDFVYVLYNYAPSDCWGSPERVRKWVQERNKGVENETTKEETPEALS